MPLPLVQGLLRVESTPPRKGRRGVNVRSRELLESFAQGRPQQELEPGLVDAGGVVPVMDAPGISLRLREIELVNFSIFPAAKATFHYDQAQPVCIIEGDNGHGKSTFLTAIRFVLYGADRSQVAKLLHLYADPPEARLEATLRFFSETLGEVVLKRAASLEDGGQGWEASKAVLTVSVLGTASTPRSLKETLHDEDAEEWVKLYLPREIMEFFCFDAENSPVISLAEGSGRLDVGEALEAVLGIASVRLAADRCAKLAKEWEKEAADSPREKTPKEAEARLAELEALQDTLERELDELHRDADRLREDRARTETQMEDFLARFDPDAEAERQEAIRSLEEHRLRLKEWERGKEERAGVVLPLQLLADHLSFTISEARKAPSQAPRGRAQGFTEALEGVARLAADGRIPWVEDPMPTAAEILERLRRELEPETPAEPTRLEFAEKEIQALEQLRKKALTSLPVRESIEGARRLRAEVALLEHTSSPASTGPRHQDLLSEHRALRERSEDLVARLARVEEKIDDRKRRHQELARELEEARRGLELARQSESRQLARKTKIELATRVGRVLGELAKELRARRVDTLEEEASAMLARITNKPQLIGGIRFDRKTLRYRVLDKSGRTLPERSTGESTVLAMAVVHGLQRASGRLLPLIVEAPLKPLDPSHTTKVLEHFFANHPGQTILLLKPQEMPAALVPTVAPRIGQWLRLHRPEPEVEVSYLTGVETV